MKKPSNKKPRVALVTIEGLSPYTQGKAHPPDLEKPNDVLHDDWDKQNWIHRAHFVGDAAVIPATAIHKALIGAAKFRGEKIPGAGNKTWTKRFGAGVMILEHPLISLDGEQLTKQRMIDGELYVDVHVPSKGDVGGSSRVWRRFPAIPEGWRAEAPVTVIDGLIDEDTFERHMVAAGTFQGIGTHRPSSNGPGTNGRFRVVDISWSEIS